MSAAPSLAVGIAAGGGAALLLSAGTLLQALDARRVEAHHGMRVSMLLQLARRPRWVLGTVIGYLAFPVQLVALAHAPLLVVQPVYAVGLLLLLLGGVIALDDQVRPSDVVGAGAIVVGLGIVSWGAPSGADPPHSRLAFGAVVGVLALLALAPYAARERSGRLVLMGSAAIGFACANLAVKGISDALARHAWDVAGAYLAGAAVGSTVGVLSQMTAFQRHRAIQVVPITWAVPIFLPALLGLALLRERWGTAVLGGAVFAGGAVLLLFGAALVARSQAVADISVRAMG